MKVFQVKKDNDQKGKERHFLRESLIKSVPRWQRIVWSVRRCRVEGCQDQQTSPERGRSSSLPTPAEKTRIRKQQTKRIKRWIWKAAGNSWLCICVVHKGYSLIRSKKNTPLSPSLHTATWTRVSAGQQGGVFMQMWTEAKTAPGVVLSR